jgi:molybdenum cofactor cytidylyltransferase
MKNDKFICIILAAGNSSRLGRPKQLLKLGQESLLQQAINVASTITDTIIVLGANDNKILNELDFPENCSYVINQDWESGMSTSIKAGVTAAMVSQPNGLLLMLCDQPFVDAYLLRNLIQRFQQTGKQIIASNYNGGSGVPAFFGPDFFSHLLNLKGQEGARKLIAANPIDVAVVDFPLGAYDVDTESDVTQILNLISQNKKLTSGS